MWARSVPDVPGLENDEGGSRIVSDELRLLEVVMRAVGTEEQKAPSVAPPPLADALADDDKRLLELRELAATAKPEDLPALFEQMHTLGAVRAHRGKGVTGSIDRE